MATENISQKAYWTGDVGQRWASDSDLFDRLLAPTTAVLMDNAEIRPGQSVLDIGCGTGASSFAAAHAVGQRGLVHGVDISEVLLARARQRAAESGERCVSFFAADAQNTRFERKYDAAISRFGVMFFSDPVAAFSNISGALKPGAQLTFITWSEAAENPWFGVPGQIRAEMTGPPPAPDPAAPGPLAFADPPRVEAILKQAGYRDIKHTRARPPLPAGASVEAAVALALRIGPARSLLNELGGTDAAREKITARLGRSLRARAGPDGVLLPSGINLYQARA